jgi:pyruvate formate lyase activating enzyme
MKKCKFFKKLEGKKVQCIACNHYCKISEGKTGICRVRKNIGGELFLLVYGLPIAVHVDPIEKKPLYHFLPGSKAFSIGTVGCNFRCDWCQNFDITLEWKTISGISMTPKKIISEAISTGCKSIAYTYNEPAIFAEFVKDCSILAKKKNLKNIWVTNGYFSKECLDYFSEDKLIDAMNIDLKSFSEETYQKYCGAKLKPVLDSIKYAYKKGIHLEITTLIIPNVNDGEKELREIAKFIFSVDKKGEIPWHISRFFPMYKMADRNQTPIETLKIAEKIGKQEGLKYVHVGNV